jgi:predicted RNase H-like HicB family nuclease
LLLFLAVLILPVVMIAVQGRRLSLQEQELARTRLEEIRKRTAAEIGQEIVTRLERIKTQEMANVPGTPIRRNSQSDPAVVAVGWVDGERLVWPWDIPSIANALPQENPEFARAINEGRRAEFAEKRYDRAADLYRKEGAMKMSKTYTVVIEKADGNYSAYVPDLPGCVAVGDTIDECEASIQEAIEGHLRVMHDEGLEIPEPRSVARQVEVVTV